MFHSNLWANILYWKTFFNTTQTALVKAYGCVVRLAYRVYFIPHKDSSQFVYEFLLRRHYEKCDMSEKLYTCDIMVSSSSLSILANDACSSIHATSACSHDFGSLNNLQHPRTELRVSFFQPLLQSKFHKMYKRAKTASVNLKVETCIIKNLGVGDKFSW